jgi:CheY-like chemotaxis protein
MDLHLRNIDGDIIIQNIKQFIDYDINIIIITCYVTQHNRLLALGANKYIVKPIDIHILLNILDTYLPVIE